MTFVKFVYMGTRFLVVFIYQMYAGTPNTLNKYHNGTSNKNESSRSLQCRTGVNDRTFPVLHTAAS